jgi:WD40 repeat protein
MKHYHDLPSRHPRGARIKFRSVVVGASFDKAEARILSWSADGTVRLWDAATGKPLGVPMQHHRYMPSEHPRGERIRYNMIVWGAVFDEAEARILSWSTGGTVLLWDAATGQPLGAPMKHDDWVIGALFDNSQARILSWSADGTVRLWNTATGQPLGAPMEHDSAVVGARFDKRKPAFCRGLRMGPSASGMRRQGSRSARR